MALVQKEIIVVELDGVNAVAFLQARQNRSRALGGLNFLAPIEDRDNAAKLAAEGTADAGVVYSGAASKEGGKQVSLDILQAVVGEFGEVVGRAQGPGGVVDMESK